MLYNNNDIYFWTILWQFEILRKKSRKFTNKNQENVQQQKNQENLQKKSENLQIKIKKNYNNKNKINKDNISNKQTTTNKQQQSIK